ncbi:Cohesin subunit psc3 [Yarrowia sp. C11]|nr:Cohesin subunit psc3 [Yarrowia sp. C11]KAG5364132.1 Cohesin subunit psc3 [Yarrowia sp. E02]
MPSTEPRRSRRTRVERTYNDDGSDSDEPAVQTRRAKRHKANSGNGSTKTNQLIDLPDEADATPNYLYDALLDNETSLTELARGWIESYEENSTFAIRDFVNMILRLAGCHDVIETHDIEEGDSAAATVAQLQDHVRDKSAAQYPLVNKKPPHKFLREHLNEFLHHLVAFASDKDLLYESESAEGNVIDNLLIWVSALSSSKLRPFRHTATVVSLMFLTNLCKVYSSVLELKEDNEKVLTNAASGKGRGSKGRNDERVSAAKDTIEGCSTKIGKLANFMNDIFETCFVNRYRDVDARIRSECVLQLNNWIENLPSVFFEDQYLRYFGWLLFDTDPGVRESVVNGLANLFDTLNTSGFLHFTERFRSRLVEMAQSDSDLDVRAGVIEFLVLLQQAGFLEQDNVDKVIMLLLDANEVVREQVVDFIVDYCNEQSEDEIKNMGKKLKAVKSVDAKWVTYKSVVAVVSSAIALKDDEDEDEEEDESSDANIEVGATIAEDLTQHYESEDVKKLLAYLLFDPSSLSKDKFEEQLSTILQLSPNQQTFLLQLISACVEGVFKESKGSRRAQESNDTDVISSLIIDETPALMDKFSSSSEMLTLSLQMHSKVDLSLYTAKRLEDQFSELHSTVCRIFKTHHNRQTQLQCVKFLASAKKQDIFPESTLPKLADLMAEISSDFSGVLADPASDWNTIASATQRVEVLCQFMPFSEISSDDSLLDDVITKVKSAVEDDDSDVHIGEFINSAINLLRLQLLWSITSSDATSDSASDFISEVLGAMKEVIMKEEMPVNVTIKTAGLFLEILVALKIKDKLALVGDLIDNEVQARIMYLFISAEFTYFEGLGEDAPAIERLPALLSADDEEQLLANLNSKNPLEDLQWLLSKISLAVTAKIVDEKWNSRLTLNQKLYG